MKINRLLLKRLVDEVKHGNKGIVIYGPRQVGKTTLVNDILAQVGLKTLVLNGDQRGGWWDALTSRELTKIALLVSGYEAVFIDEAQRIPEIGLSLKILFDNFPNMKVIVTGSSSLDLASKISEPLTGRIYSFRLYPISQRELAQTYTPHELNENLEKQLLFGSYPELYSKTDIQDRILYLQNLTSTYLYKDLLEFGDIRNSSKIQDLLKLLAYQIGDQVSLTELSQSLEISRSTVDRYIDLLEKSFVIFRLHGFSRNLRKEVTKMDKIYFYDVGVRNAIIGNFNFLKGRDDAGKLWENFLIIERMKRQEYAQTYCSYYFWRLTSGAEIDFVEEVSGVLAGYELKYSSKIVRPKTSWTATYPGSSFATVNRDNWQEFV